MKIIPCSLLLVLTCCGRPTAPTPEENRQLDNAAEMLDAAPRTLGNIDANAHGPVDSNASDTPPPLG